MYNRGLSALSIELIPSLRFANVWARSSDLVNKPLNVIWTCLCLWPESRYMSTRYCAAYQMFISSDISVTFGVCMYSLAGLLIVVLLWVCLQVSVM